MDLQRRQRQAQDVGQEQADDQAEVHGRDGVEPFAADGDVQRRSLPSASKISPPNTDQAIHGESCGNQTRIG